MFSPVVESHVIKEMKPTALAASIGLKARSWSQIPPLKMQDEDFRTEICGPGVGTTSEVRRTPTGNGARPRSGRSIPRGIGFSARVDIDELTGVGV